MKNNKGSISRNNLLSSAEKLFSINGYHGTTVSQIVSDAGLTQASFYQYFSSKEDILNEIFNKFEKMLKDFVVKGSKVSQRDFTEVENYLISTYTDLFQLLGTNKNVTKIVLNEGKKSEELRNKIVESVVINIRSNQQAGIVRPEINAYVFAELLVSTVESTVNYYGSNENYFSENLGKSLGEIILHGVLVRDFKN